MFKLANEGLLAITSELLATGEDWLLCLAASQVVQAEDDDASKYLAAEATFPGYERKRVSRGLGPGKWGAPAFADPIDPEGVGNREKVAASTYGEEFRWTLPASGPSTVAGWFLIGADSGLLIMTDILDCPTTMCGGASVYTPYFEFG